MRGPSVLVIGTGSIGCCYVYLLTKGGCKVTAVCRSNYDAISSSGIHIQSPEHVWGNVHCTPHRVVRKTQECQETFDYVLVCAKTFPERASFVEDIRPVLGKDTLIVLIQNGIGIEEPYQAAFPGQVISGVVYLPVSQPQPGHCSVKGPDILELGTFPASPPPPSLKRLESRLLAGGAHVACFEDIQARRWKKSIINACWNPLAALCLNTDSDFIHCHPEAPNVLRATMHEVAAVATKLGYPLGDAEIEEQVTRAFTRAKHGTGIKMSMLADVENGSPMEVEAVVGNIVRIAREQGIQTPRLEMLWMLAHAKDQHLTGKKQ
ncbi:2-dehydropantoate 2-reductase [Protomyces lactucae-debilis]|uniref:2-dehydropantoate 2-reductase n=1 Tax=Protomyces lactucae-debilis TaxID=2754530 RepID=A0A1Y2F590_PROLT|nr:2-dehydropantoate 2-reductase [Protomyces lactucae-debilis]ORY79029.1 2-dehydropantoate 2-reductase [Protomyces lactucae-debilis]